MSYQFAEVAAPKGAPLLFLFHGTGGDEHDLLQLGAQLLPGAHLISARGDVSENGALRFFRRAGMGVYNMADLERATEKMIGFVRMQTARVGAEDVAGLGYSNGANILASVLFRAPELFGRAVLMHPLIPFVPPPQPSLSGKPILITAGRNDPIAPADSTAQLQAYFATQGADAQITWHEGGHNVQQSELVAAREFLRH